MATKSNQRRHASWWRIGNYRGRLSPVARAELQKIKAILTDVRGKNVKD